MSVDRKAREDIRQDLANFMTGKMNSFAFDERISRFRDGKGTNDVSLCAICHALWNIYDGLIDHPISVSQEQWLALRRTLAFLKTELELEETINGDAWPFADVWQWRRYEALADGIQLPTFDPTIHSRPANPWWNRIPTTVGLAIILGLLLLLVVLIQAF